MLSDKQTRSFNETVNLYAHKSETVSTFTMELIIAMDEQYLDAFLKDFILDKDEINTYGGKTFKGAVHYARPYINKSIKSEIEETLYTIRNLINGIYNNINYEDNVYDISFKGESLMTRKDFDECMGYGYDFLTKMEAKLKEIALAERGVKNIGDTLSNPEPVLALETY